MELETRYSNAWDGRMGCMICTVVEDYQQGSEGVEEGVKQKMIVCRTKTTYRLSDGTWVVNTADALKRLAAV